MQGHYTGWSTVGEDFQCNSQWIKENTRFMQVSLDFRKPISTWEVNRGNCQDKQCCAASWLDLAHSKEDKEQVEACNQDYPLPYTHRAITYTSILYLWSKCSCPPAHYCNFLLVSNPTYASCSKLVKPKLLTFLPFFFLWDFGWWANLLSETTASLPNLLHWQTLAWGMDSSLFGITDTATVHPAFVDIFSRQPMLLYGFAGLN